MVRCRTAHHGEGRSREAATEGVQVGDAKEVIRVFAVVVKIKGWVWSAF